ncbi:DUF3653 domain-containing protein [Thioalkalivibrio thiocyanodenitrificans]|uniref:DUF3653 domain-containing protein n=1 Tax=Thioalkalivibrio thiocyanodenitrificans TaxID=243063 RepID=UPI0038CDAC0A
MPLAKEWRGWRIHGNALISPDGLEFGPKRDRRLCARCCAGNATADPTNETKWRCYRDRHLQAPGHERRGLRQVDGAGRAA